MNANLAHASAQPLAVPTSPRATAHMSKRAKTLKLALGTHLRATRTRLGLDRHDIYDKPSFVTRWESPEEPHAPNVFHLVEIGSDPLSRPYALEAIEWARETIERAQEHNPAQLSLFAFDTNATNA